jgi:hypothetical protein
MASRGNVFEKLAQMGPPVLPFNPRNPAGINTLPCVLPLPPLLAPPPPPVNCNVRALQACAPTHGCCMSAAVGNRICRWMADAETTERPFRVLSLSGGGVRGIVSAVLIKVGRPHAAMAH